MLQPGLYNESLKELIFLSIKLSSHSHFKLHLSHLDHDHYGCSLEVIFTCIWNLCKVQQQLSIQACIRFKLGMKMKTNLLNFISLFIVQVNCKCRTWSPEQQSREPSLYIHLAAGRLGARISPYMVLLILRNQILKSSYFSKHL